MYSPLRWGRSRRCWFVRGGGWRLLLFFYGQLHQFLFVENTTQPASVVPPEDIENLLNTIDNSYFTTKGPTFTPSSTALMTLVTDATFSLSSKSMPSSITWSAQRMRLARLWYTRLWQEDSAELLKRCQNRVGARVRVEQSIEGGKKERGIQEVEKEKRHMDKIKKEMVQKPEV